MSRLGRQCNCQEDTSCAPTRGLEQTARTSPDHVVLKTVLDDLQLHNLTLSVLMVVFPGGPGFSRWTSRYQNLSILDFIRAKDEGGGGDNWSYKK